MARPASLPAALLAAVLVLSAVPAAAGDARRTDSVTGWHRLYAATEAQVSAVFTSNPGVRLHDLEVEQGSPALFSAVFVNNTGDYLENGNAWAYDRTEVELRALVTANAARLIDVERYTVNGNVRYAGVMVGNTGAFQRDTWWYVDKTAAEIGTLLDQNDARLIDLETYVVGGTRLYTCLMVENTGPEATGWWWLLGVTESTLDAFQTQNSARIYSLGTYLEGGTRVFNAILVPQSGAWNARQWWFHGLSATGVEDACAQHGARIGDIEAYTVLVGLNPVTRYAVTLINNESDYVQRIGDILGYGTDGVTGFRLKRVNGPVVGDLNENYESEPASTIKIFHLLHTMRQVQLGADDLSTFYFMGNGYTDPGGSCPTGSSPFLLVSLRQIAWLMMMQSDNAATEFLRSKYGTTAINLTASLWGGVQNSSIHHTVGCGEEAVENPNRFTAADMCRIYENIADASAIAPEWRDTLLSYVAGPGSSMAGTLRTIAGEEAAALGTPLDVLNAFKAGIEVRYKPGGYGLYVYPPPDPGRGFFSRAGWVRLPLCGSGSVEYGFGAFVNLAIDQNAAATRLTNACGEMFREEIRAALAACTVDAPLAAASSTGLWLAPPAPNPVAAGGAALRFALPEAGDVRLAVLDVTGRRVASLIDGPMAPGAHAARWDARDGGGEPVPAGVYFARLEAAGEVRTRKLIVTR